MNQPPQMAVVQPAGKPELLPFSAWMRRLRRRILAVLGTPGLLLVISIALRLGQPLLNWPQEDWLFTVIAAVHAIMIILVLLFPVTWPEFEDVASSDGVPFQKSDEDIMKSYGYNEAHQWDSAKEQAHKSLEAYYKSWRALWFCWFLLYAAVGAAYCPPIAPHEITKIIIRVTATVIANAATLMLLFCYLDLARPTLAHRQRIEYFRWVIIAIVLTALEVVCLLSFWDKREPIAHVSDWVSGIAAATVMGLYIGRLDRSPLDAPRFLIVLMYLYAAIQPAYALIGQQTPQPLAAVIVIAAAFILKSCLFLLMAWLFQTGRLLFYFVRIGPLHQKANQDLRDFKNLLAS